MMDEELSTKEKKGTERRQVSNGMHGYRRIQGQLHGAQESKTHMH